jgi:threonine/homoserine/homoserine lactone efflux protein
MFDSTRLFLFLTAALLLAIAPGPGMLYVLARSLAGGRREGVLSALGTFLGGMVHVLAAAFGVSVVLARSATAFATVKYAGAAYLCFLGVRMILDARRQEGPAAADFPHVNSRLLSGPRETRCGRAWRRKYSIPRQRCSFFPSSRNSSAGAAGTCSCSSSRWEPCRLF